MWTFLLYLAVFVALDLLKPKPKLEDARPSGLGDFNFPTATEGRIVPLVWGTVLLEAPNVVWFGNFRSRARTQNVRTGLFSSDEVVIGYKYYVGMQMALCHGPVDKLVDIWIDGEPLGIGPVAGSGACNIDLPDLMGGVEDGGGFEGDGYFYQGNLTDSVDTYLDGQITDPVPAYRGLCHYVWEGGYVGTYTNIPVWAFEVQRLPDGLDLATHYPGAETVNDGKDCNPMNALYELMTNDDWGLQISASDINRTNLRAAANVLKTENNGWSFVLDREMSAEQVKEEIERQINGQLYFNRTDGVWEIKLARQDYTPSALDLYDESNVIELVNFARATWEETVNEVRLGFHDRGDDYRERFAFAQDMANNIAQSGAVSTTVQFPGVKVPALANQLCWRTLRELSYPLAQLEIKCNRSAFTHHPGSVFRFSNLRLGISEVVFRVIKLDYGSPENDHIRVWAVQDIFALGVGIFGIPSTTGWEEPLDDYELVTLVNSLILEAPRQMVVQDPFNPQLQTRIWQGARDPGGSTSRLHVYQRSGTSRPVSGAYSADSFINTFLLAGTLKTAIPAYYATATRPAIETIEVNELDQLDDLELIGNADTVSGLLTICYIDGEYIGYEVVTDATTYFTLTRIYRGLFHTAPKAHAIGTRVWFIGQSGGGLTRTAWADTYDEIDTQLRSVNREEESTLGETPVNEVGLEYLYEVPLAPRDPQLHGSYAPSAASLDTSYTTETGLTGDDARALEVEVTPRAWRVEDILEDTNLDQSTPYAYLDDNPEFDFVLTMDPSGTPKVVETFTEVNTETPTAYILRNAVIKAMGANTAMATDAKLVVTARHNPDDVTGSPENPVGMEFSFDVTSSLQGQDLMFGGFAVSTPSTGVTFGETGSYTFDIHTALPSSGIVQISVNGGGWLTVITAGNSSGSRSITAGSSVQIQFTQAPTSDQFFDVTGPTAEVGYGVLEA